MSWWAILGLAGCIYVTKALSPIVLGGRDLPHRTEAILAIVAAPMLAALVMINTITEGREFVVDARLPAVAVALVAVWRRAPFLLIVVLAGLTCAAVRALTPLG